MPDRVAAIAEPTRRRLLHLLSGGEQTVNELAAQFAVTRSAISQHLGILVDAGLITRTRDGRFQRYQLAPAGMAGLRADLDSFWTSELDQLVYDALERRPASDDANSRPANVASTASRERPT